MTILLAKQMFDALKHDYKKAFNATKSPSLNVGHINIETYKIKFNVSDEDIASYCSTLQRIDLKYHTCPMCGTDWRYDPDIDGIKPVSNGHVFFGVDYIETFCPSEKHDSFWYTQTKDGNCSFEREMNNLNGNDFYIRWNCCCAVDECRGKNHILLITGSDRQRTLKYTTIKYFDPPLPLNISNEDIWKQIEGLMLLL